MRSFSHAAIACLLMVTSGCGEASDEFSLGGYRYSTDAFEQWKLPKSLREISGLAVTPDGRVFAHADERAEIHQLDYHAGRLVKSFVLAKANGKTLKGDFEALAAVNDDLYLMTSNGLLHRFRPGTDGARVPYETMDSGAGALCELEGLTFDSRHNGLLMACKHVYASESDVIMILFFSLVDRALDPGRSILINLRGRGPVNPSDITFSPRSGNLIMVAARQHIALEITPQGEMVAVFRWPMERYHRQTEGIAQLADGTLLVADEGSNKRGRLGVYRAIN